MTRWAIVSVTDKRNLEELAPLVEHDWEFISTGKTLESLIKVGIPTIPVEVVTGFPEMMGGRLKTMHPMIEGGILARRDNPDDMEAAAKHGIRMIDLVVVNLYDFAGKPGIEQIDVGGPTMLRSAAKNYQSVMVLCDPQHYHNAVSEIIADEILSLPARKLLARQVFRATAAYDAAISEWDGWSLA